MLQRFRILLAAALTFAGTTVLAGTTVFAETSALAGVEVVVDGGKRFQVMEGFGTCLVSWDGRLSEWYQRPEAARMYADELRFNILRCNLWGDGTIGPREVGKISFRDPEFAAKDPRTPVFIRFAQAVRKINPELKVIGSVWSPPVWMKVNGKITDDASGAIQGETYVGDKGGRQVEFTNRVKEDHHPHFARWVVEMVRHYEAAGVPMYAVSPANEPQFTQSFESCVWTAKDLATITGLLGEELEKARLGRVKVFGPETMTGFNWDNGPNHRYTRAMREDARAWKHLDFWATHGYADGVVGDVSSNSSAKFWSIIEKDKRPYWVTGGGRGGHDWPEPVGEKGVGVAIHNAFVAGNASAFVPWQFAENSRSEHNLMPLEGPSKKTHVVRHYSRFIPEGSVRVDASPAFGETMVSAYTFTAGGRAGVTIVVLNTGEEDREVELSVRQVAGVGRLNVIRTSATEDSATLAAVALSAGKGKLPVPGRSITTLTTLRP
jgi:glucuronoarabinoxylan endo-1,4-beta-xylanase